ncbi:MAG: hypothetical protein Kow006_30400 [Gammaproteobacteria bacterium]
MKALLLEGVPRSALVWLALFFGLLALAPLVLGDYLISVLILVLYFAFVGQAWNVMMGYAG